PSKIPSSRTLRLALAGNPNCGKTTLFNALTGLRAHTANYPGTTVERRTGRLDIGGESVALIDLPGLYDFQANTDEERVARDVLARSGSHAEALAGVILVADASHLSRSLFLMSQVLEKKLPVVVALNMVDLAECEGVHVDA